MKASEFFVGFGPRLWSFRRGETEYGVKAIPAGGLRAHPRDEQPRGGRPRRRAAHLPARHHQAPARRRDGRRHGERAHRVLPLLHRDRGSGSRRRRPDDHVSSVVAKSAAAEAGMQPGDKIVAVDGKPISGWDQLKSAIESHGGKATTFTVVRDGLKLELPRHAEASRAARASSASAPTTVYRDVGVFEAVPESFRAMGDHHRRDGRRHRAPLLAVGRREVLQELHVVGAQGGHAPRPTRGPARSSASSTRARSIVDGNVWALLWLLGGDQPRARPVQRDPAPALRRRPRRGRRSTSAIASKVKRRDGAGRLPQAHARHRGRARRLPHAGAQRDVPRHPAGRRQVVRHRQDDHRTTMHRC